MSKSTNITWQNGHISRQDRAKLLQNPNKVIWFTGLSGSGKSTIAHELERILHEKEIATMVLDGDNIRLGLNKDLGFSAKDRTENIRRISEVAKLLYDAGLTVVVSFISPYAADRAAARELIGKDFIEVFVNTPIQECEKRDPKGLYKKARAGSIENFTGIDAPYEIPENPEIILTPESSPEDSAMQIVRKISEN